MSYQIVKLSVNVEVPEGIDAPLSTLLAQLEINTRREGLELVVRHLPRSKRILVEQLWVFAETLFFALALVGTATLLPWLLLKPWFGIPLVYLVCLITRKGLKLSNRLHKQVLMHLLIDVFMERRFDAQHDIVNAADKEATQRSIHQQPPPPPSYT